MISIYKTVVTYGKGTSLILNHKSQSNSRSGIPSYVPPGWREFSSGARPTRVLEMVLKYLTVTQSLCKLLSPQRMWSSRPSRGWYILSALSQIPKGANIISTLNVTILERNMPAWLKFLTIQLNSLVYKMRKNVIFITSNVLSENKKIKILVFEG